MQPINDVKLHEYALQFLGTFLLSSLVRYRPQIWQNAISRSVTANSAADDRALSLIEKFLDVTLSGFPNMVVHVIIIGASLSGGRVSRTLPLVLAHSAHVPRNGRP